MNGDVRTSYVCIINTDFPQIYMFCPDSRRHIPNMHPLQKNKQTNWEMQPHTFCSIQTVKYTSEIEDPGKEGGRWGGDFPVFCSLAKL